MFRKLCSFVDRKQTAIKRAFQKILSSVKVVNRTANLSLSYESP